MSGTWTNLGVQVETPGQCLGGPGDIRVGRSVTSLEAWAAGGPATWARLHAPAHPVWPQMRNSVKSLQGYRDMIHGVEQRAISAASQLGLGDVGDRSDAERDFTDDLWGVPLRWSARTLEGSWETAPVAVIEDDRRSGADRGKDSWALNWYYGSNVRPVAWAGSREELMAAEKWFNEIGELWLEDSGVRDVMAAHVTAKEAVEELGRLISQMTLEDLREGRCPACPTPQQDGTEATDPWGSLGESGHSEWFHGKPQYP